MNWTKPCEEGDRAGQEPPTPAKGDACIYVHGIEQWAALGVSGWDAFVIYTQGPKPLLKAV
jgi:hypothetical protein